MATRSGSSEVPQKVSPRAVRQLRPTTLDTDSVSSLSQATKSSKERSPKVTERRSPRSPIIELMKEAAPKVFSSVVWDCFQDVDCPSALKLFTGWRKRPSKISELESQISQLQNDLKKVKDQLILSESSKKQALEDAKVSKEQLLAISAKLEESQKQVLDLCAAGEARVVELQKIIEERDMACQSELEASKKQLSVDSAALASAMNEIQMLNAQLELVASCENVQSQHAESADIELLNLKQYLSETLSLVDNMKNQLMDCKESEAQAQALVNETMLQLEDAKGTVELLRSDVAKAVDGYNSIALELDQSKMRVNSLEELVGKLETHPINNKSAPSEKDDHNFEHQPEILKEGEDTNQLEAEVASLKSEVKYLRSAIETAETKYQEQQIQSAVQIRHAYELVEQIKSESGQRECELEAELKSKKADIEELKANLMDKETELQGIVEENENLILKLTESLSSQNEHEHKREIQRLEDCVVELKADMMDKETTLQSISEENEMLKMEINKLSGGGKLSEEVAAEVERAKASEREAHMKLSIVMEEADKSNKKAARVAEQLEAAQAANSEMEAELRRLKVQSDQWRKAAEAAATMLSVAAEVERAKASEREAHMKLSIVMEEADKSNKKAARVAEQLEAAQAANSEMEAELRRLKVQSDQWRKAAEAAATMLSAGSNGKITERTVSLDNNSYKCSPYAEDMDDDLQRKKNSNMLKKIGVLWKKPQK
uniref:Interactor of constitutive active ROPs 3 n=1 Tax=Cajanus cajan TaxID=3821 RepID=A0A151TN46_CAJCA|nr:Interactor of constitutive active ROPs 3 [Cajanus cajan]